MLNYFNNNKKLFFRKKNDVLTDGKNNYPIINSIPRFNKSNIDYAAMWGEQWGHYQLTQFDSYTKTNLTKDRLEFILGKKVKILKNKNILEVGSGAGRFTEVLLKARGNVHTIDASKAVDYNYNNNRKKSKKFKICQADLYNIPYEDSKFDYVICIGVLQHTPDTLKSLKCLWKKVKPGGYLLVDHYEFTIGYYFGLLWIFRLFLKNISNSSSIKICKFIVKIFFPILWTSRNYYYFFRILRKIFPLGFNYHDRKTLNKKQHYQWTELDTHDAMTDPYKRLLTKAKFNKMLRCLNGRIDLLSSLRPGGNGLEARIKKIKKG